VQAERDEYRMANYVPVRQSPLIMPHSRILCLYERQILMWCSQSWLQPLFRRLGRLKAGCGQDCPPHKGQLQKLGLG
jgi:hypothetical protein